MPSLRNNEQPGMTKAQCVGDEVVEDDSRKLYCILGLYP